MLFFHLHRQKAVEATKRIEEEKRSAYEAKLKSLKKQQSSKIQAQNMISNAVASSRKQLKFASTSISSKNEANSVKLIGKGFVASAGGQETVDDDPLGQQIVNLKKFIQQAKDAGQFDDAQILENNLRDLQEEYRQQKTNEQVELQQNYEQFKDLFGKSTEEDTSEDLDESNPFYDAQEQLSPDSSRDEDYDKSGKNPFA